MGGLDFSFPLCDSLRLRTFTLYLQNRIASSRGESRAVARTHDAEVVGRMIDLAGKRVALITGASTGIGLAIAERLLAGGMFVILTARESSVARFSRVDFLQDPSAYWVRTLDVTNALQRRELIDEIERKIGRLDLLVNNAGVIYRTPLEYAYDFESREQMLVNFHAPLELIKCCLPLMCHQGSGYIMNISSAAGFFAVPTMGLYAASKHALEAASEALHHELKPWNIHLTLVQPGFVSSEVYQHSHLGLAFSTHRRSSSAVYDSQSRALSALIDKAVQLTTITPEKIAETVWQLTQMRKPPLRAQVTLDAQVFHFLKRFMPEAMFENLIGFCLKKLGQATAHSA